MYLREKASVKTQPLVTEHWPENAPNLQDNLLSDFILNGALSLAILWRLNIFEKAVKMVSSVSLQTSPNKCVFVL